jgi:type I restriction enzyme S subunit
MASEWRRTTLGEVLTLQRGFDLPVDDRKDGAVPVIASTGQVGTHNEAKVIGPGVVIGRSGSIGGGQYIRENFWPLNTTLWVKDFKSNDARFCYYLLTSLDFAGYNAGSGVPTLNRNHIHPMQISVPPLPEQRAIAHILGTLDDKIALNRRQSATLEEMARALFKAWFVDFEPVRARMAGRPSASAPGELGELFPARLVDSELGEVPEGWRVGAVSELGRVVTGKTPPTAKAECFGGEVPFVRIPDMHGQVFVVKTTLMLTGAGSASQPKQLVPENSVCVSCIATPGVVALTSRPSHTNQQINTVVCRSGISPYWVYFLMEALKDEILTRASGGSATLNLNKGEFSKIDVLLPTNRVLRSFDSLVKDAFLRILSLAFESETLGALRDALLPRLVSGEVRVEEAEWLINV